VEVSQCVRTLSKPGARRDQDAVPAPGPPLLAAGEVARGFLQLGGGSFPEQRDSTSSLAMCSGASI